MRMKGIVKVMLSGMIAAAILLHLGSCQTENNTVDTDKVSVSKGYSLDQFGLQLSSDTGLLEQQMQYSNQVKINGNYTEVRASRSGDGLLALQGFYKEDLLHSEIFINGRTFSNQELTDRLVYEDNEIVVYDISHYVFPNSAVERLETSQTTKLQATDCIHHVSEYIVPKNSEKTYQQKPQQIQNPENPQTIRQTVI